MQENHADSYTRLVQWIEQTTEAHKNELIYGLQNAKAFQNHPNVTLFPQFDAKITKIRIGMATQQLLFRIVKCSASYYTAIVRKLWVFCGFTLCWSQMP